MVWPGGSPLILTDTNVSLTGTVTERATAGCRVFDGPRKTAVCSSLLIGSTLMVAGMVTGVPGAVLRTGIMMFCGVGWLETVGVGVELEKSRVVAFSVLFCASKVVPD